MLVSVIIPAYNSEKTIAKTIQSVLNQDYSPIEVIVVNDGSLDNTEKIVKEFKEVKYISQKNSGVSVARNNGLSHANGEFIQYLDADDLLAEGKLRLQVTALQNNNADVAYGDWKKFIEEDSIFKELELVKRSMDKRPEIELITDFWIPLAALLYSRKIVDKIGGWNLNLPIIQDARYALDAARHGAKFIYTEGVMAYYRAHTSGSLSTKSRISFMTDCLNNAIEIDLDWRNYYHQDLEKKDAIINVLRFCVNEFSGIDKNLHKKAVDKILEIDPNYIPKGSKGLIALSKLFGYRNAERLAYYKRKLN